MVEKKVQGYELQDQGNNNFKLPQSSCNAIMDKYGITKDVRESLQNAEEAMIKDSLDVAAGTLCENEDPGTCKVVLGRGDGKKTVSVTGRKEERVMNPRTQEIQHRVRYGAAQVHEGRRIPKSLKEERLEQIEENCRKAFSQR